MAGTTYDLIMAIKGNIDAAHNCCLPTTVRKLKPYERAKKYYAVLCDVPVTHYTDDVMKNIVFDVMCDYVTTCDDAGAFLRQLREVTERTPDLCTAEHIVNALGLV